MEAMKKKLMLTENARHEKQLAKMQECLSLGLCPFCPEHFKKYHDAPVLMEGNWWIITKNDYPYEGSTHHYLAIAKNFHTDSHKTSEHPTDLKDIHPVAWPELFKLFTDLEKKLEVKGGGVFLRFGDMSRTGATIAHIHVHFIVGGEKKDGSEWLCAALGYKNK